MKRRYVLDAGVIALYFAGRKDAKKYVDEVYSGRSEAFICEVNLAEFIYNYARIFGWDAALARHSLLRNSPIAIAGVDELLTVKAAKLKLKHFDVLSLADCYLIALAKKLKAKLVTTDSKVKEVQEANTELLPL